MEAVVTRAYAPPSSHAWQWRNPLIAGGFIAGGVALPALVDSRLLMTLLVQATINGILALSVGTLFRFNGVISFGHAAFYGLAVYIVALGLKVAGGPGAVCLTPPRPRPTPASLLRAVG